MRRRVRDAGAASEPSWLVRYDPHDWIDAPGVTCGHPECAFWAAREVWDEQHPAEWRSVVAEGPDVPFGPTSGHWDYW